MATSKKTIDLPLSRDQQRFVLSKAPIVAFIGPEGEGKTYAGLCACLSHAQRQGSLRAALIRDTLENIKSKTIESIQKAVLTIAEANNIPQFAESWDYAGDGKLIRNRGLDIKIDCFGANELGDLTRLHGGEWNLIWLEEPAPTYATATAGIPEYVFNACVTRSQRGQGKGRLQITMNPADEDHWTYDRLIQNPIMRPEYAPNMWTEILHAKPGSNPARTEQQRQASRAAYINDHGLWQRYIEGKFAPVQIGEAVTPEYDENIHRAKMPLKVIPGVRGLRFWDAGHNPTCIIGQINPMTGRLQIYDTIVGENIGMIQLVSGVVRPLLAQKYKNVVEWSDSGDPALNTRDQSDINFSPAKVIESNLGTKFLPGVKDWNTRTQAIKHILQSMPMLLLCPTEQRLHKALRGGWHYAKTADGRIVRGEAVKDIHSHPADALSQGLPTLIGLTHKLGNSRSTGPSANQPALAGGVG
jgi:hypothetical protein